MRIVQRFLDSWSEHPDSFDRKLRARTGEDSEAYRVISKLNEQTEFIDANVIRLLRSLGKLHERYYMEDDDEGYPLFMCRHRNVPSPCPTMMDVHDIEEYVL